jgi:hypothetical protein
MVPKDRKFFQSRQRPQPKMPLRACKYVNKDRGCRETRLLKHTKVFKNLAWLNTDLAYFKNRFKPGIVTYTCNSSYSAGRGRRIVSSKSA